MQQPDLTLVLCCTETPSIKELQQYNAIASQLIIICREGLSVLSTDYSVISYEQSIGKVAAINAAVLQAKRSHVLWLEQGESIPNIPDLNADAYAIAKIKNTENDPSVLNRQIRLFPNPGTQPFAFSGFEIPNIYEKAVELSWQQSSCVLSIKRDQALFSVDAIEREVKFASDSSMHGFWQGMWATKNEHFTRAIDYFKQFLNKQNVSLWNKLAALNSLANNYIETHQLSEAKITAEQSLGISQNQRAPYLTLYQACNYSGETDKAYETLVRYSRAATDESDANWDVYLPQAQAAFLMAQIALKQGKHKKAYRHYEQFYVFNNGGVSEDVLEKLFLYAVELQDRAKAIQYFEALFGDPFPKDITPGQSARIREALALFSDKGWYDYASKIYQQLVSSQPEDENLRNGLIRVLVKNDEISKAQALL